MNVFNLRDQLVGNYSSYVKSFININDEAIQAHVGQRLDCLSRCQSSRANCICWVSSVILEVQNPTLDTLLSITSVLEVDLEKIIAQARKRASGKME
jgi:hypothetical protein